MTVSAAHLEEELVEPAAFDGEPLDPLATPAERDPAVPGFPFALAGACTQISGPTGAGRSTLAEVGLYDGAKIGLHSAYLGSEVQLEEFNARGRDIARRRGDKLDDELRRQLAVVRYLDLASTVTVASRKPDEWADQIPRKFVTVVFDPLAAVASALGLDFDTANSDYDRFYDRLVQPLVNAGVSVVLLDNIGHAIDARTRARGASAKGARADITVHAAHASNPEGLKLTIDKVRPVRAPFRRGDAWLFTRATLELTSLTAADRQSWRPTTLMEKASRAIEETPGLTATKIAQLIGGKRAHALQAVSFLVSDGFVHVDPDGRYPTHKSIEPYRASGTGTPSIPDRFPVPVADTGTPVPPSLRRGTGTAPPEDPGE
ncbi:MAG TPA: hypothetical protein VMA83_00735 [Solirubrobacteraceae bacterium]|nr:hypothetical protein [Solirubrobacteraceae bacterium]